VTVTVTLAHLQKIRACAPAREWFMATYGSDAAVPLATVLRAAAEHKSGTNWVQWYAGDGHLPASAWAAHRAATAPAEAAYDAAVATARAAYRAGIAPAEAAYRAARRLAIVAAAEALEAGMEGVTA